MFKYTNILSGYLKNVQTNSTRSISFRGIAKLLSIYFYESTENPKPPYDYICNANDPVLRKKATSIDTKIIQTEEFQTVIKHFHQIMRKYEAIGLAAPQIGLPWQLFAIEMTEENLKTIHPELRKFCGMEAQPLTYFINPTMEIINPEEITHYETCCSIESYQAHVPRATEIQIKALNQFGEPFCWKAKNWLARVAQHEMDHLQGTLYTDKMFPFSFRYCNWKNIDTDSEKAITK